MHGAREAGARADVDVHAALDWRDFMVSNYSDAGAAQWLADRGIALLRGRGRLAGTGVVEVEGVRYTADHVVLANGADPVVPPVPGLRELDGVWGTNEATGMKAVPRQLVVLGGGAAGVELAQVVRRLGGEAALVEGSERVLAREPAPLGAALGEALRRDGIELVLGSTRSRHPATARTSCCDWRMAGSCAVIICWWRPDGARASRGSGWRPSASTADAHGIPVDAHMRAGERLWAIGDVTGIWQLTHVGEYQGEVVASNILGEHVRPTTRRYRASPTPIRRPRRWARPRPVQRHRAVSEVAKTATYTHAYAESNGFLTLLSDGEHLTGAYALGPEAGEWLQQATLAIRARVPLEVLRDTIQPFPSFSEIHAAALKALRHEIATQPRGRSGIAMSAISWIHDTGGNMTTTSASPPREPELLGQTVVLIGGSAGIGLETARRARSRGRRDRPYRPQSASGLSRQRGTSARGARAAFDVNDRASAEAVLRRPAGTDRPCARHAGPPPTGRSSTEDRRSGAPQVSDHLALGARGRPECSPPDEARRHASAHGRHRRAADQPWAGHCVSGHRGAASARRGLALELAPVRVNLIAPGFVDTPLSASTPRRRARRRRDELRPRSRSAGSSGRPTSLPSPST